MAFVAPNTASMPPEMTAEKNRATRWKTVWGLTALSGWFVIVIFSPLVFHGFNVPLSQAFVDTAIGYITALPFDPVGPFMHMVTREGSHVTLLQVGIALLGGATLAAVVGYIGVTMCPYRDYPMIHGDARWANAADLAEMEEAEQFGPKGRYLHLGYAPFADGKELRLIETLSSICYAPPGTGKTTRIVIPAILSTPDACLIVNDPKPELWDKCSGYRATIGQVFRLDWGQQDDPAEDVFHPKFNFIAKAAVPPDIGRRSSFVDALSKVIIPEKKGGGDTYFVNQGRAAFVGFTHFLIASINDRDDPNRWALLPDRWHGRESSFPMLVDWLIEQERLTNSGGGEDDPWRTMLTSLIEEATANDYPRACISNLQPLVNMADKERSGVIGSMNEGLLSFRNATVIERTEDSDFTPSDLGGRLRPESLKRLGFEDGAYPRKRAEWDTIEKKINNDDWQPCDVFVCVNQEQAQAFEVVTALFFETCSRILISYAPGDRTSDGTIMGPFATGFIMDELVKMARCDAVVQGPDLGRSKKRFYMLIMQSIAQIQQVYSAEQRKVLGSSCSITIVLVQNDAETIEEISKKVGKTTVKRKNMSYTGGLSMKANPWSGNVSTQLDAVSMLRTDNVGSMPPGKQILIVQNFAARPIMADSCICFKDPVIKHRMFDDRSPPEGQKFPPAKPLPDHIHQMRLKHRNDAAKAATLEKNINEAEALFDEWRFAVDIATIANTPEDGP